MWYRESQSKFTDPDFNTDYNEEDTELPSVYPGFRDMDHNHGAEENHYHDPESNAIYLNEAASSALNQTGGNSLYTPHAAFYPQKDAVSLIKRLREHGKEKLAESIEKSLENTPQGVMLVHGKSRQKDDPQLQRILRHEGIHRQHALLPGYYDDGGDSRRNLDNSFGNWDTHMGFMPRVHNTYHLNGQATEEVAANIAGGTWDEIFSKNVSLADRNQQAYLWMYNYTGALLREYGAKHGADMIAGLFPQAHPIARKAIQNAIEFYREKQYASFRQK